jgi:hypothetical protein
MPNTPPTNIEASIAFFQSLVIMKMVVKASAPEAVPATMVAFLGFPQTEQNPIVTGEKVDVSFHLKLITEK